MIDDGPWLHFKADEKIFYSNLERLYELVRSTSFNVRLSAFTDFQLGHIGILMVISAIPSIWESLCFAHNEPVETL